MTISIYTFVRNGLYYDYHVVEMLKHHLPLADEIIVNEGYSTDGTYEAIRDLDPKIRIIRNEWDRSDPYTWHLKFKETARQQCTGDWCILLDSDEFIPEWEFDRLRRVLAETEQVILPLRFLHFYGNHRVYKARWDSIKHTPVLGSRIHRNLPEIEVWGDGANVKLKDQPYSPPSSELAFECHHFGEVRHPARLRQKWRTQANQHSQEHPRWDWLPGFIFNLFPHDWNDPDFLADLDVYDGPYIKAVRENEDEFVRDQFYLYELLSSERKRKRLASGTAVGTRINQ